MTEPLDRPSFGPPTLIASDVDGTLIDNDDLVTERTRAVLKRAAATGVPLVLATGRPPRWIPQITDQLADDGVLSRYVVCANGAILYDVIDDAVLHAATLDPEVIEELASVAYRTLPGCGLAVERPGQSAYDAATPLFIATAGYQHAWLNPDHVEVGEADIWAEPVVKVLVRQPGAVSGEMAAAMEETIGDLAEVTFSTDNGLIELSVPNVNKATGLARLLNSTDLPGGSVVAFGDMPNDIEMLRWAGHGVAMGHGHPAARAAADEVTGTNTDDGLAQILERWF